MKWSVTVIVLFVWVANFAQSIEVIQYSAEFVKDNEISLKTLEAMIQTLCICLKQASSLPKIKLNIYLQLFFLIMVMKYLE